FTGELQDAFGAGSHHGGGRTRSRELHGAHRSLRGPFVRGGPGLGGNSADLCRSVQHMAMTRAFRFGLISVIAGCALLCSCVGGKTARAYIPDTGGNATRGAQVIALKG